MPALKQWAPHGTVRRYRQGGCNELRGGERGAGDRCAECKAAMADYNQQRKAGETPINNVVNLGKAKLHTVESTGTPMNSLETPVVGDTENAILTQFKELIDKGEHLVLIQMARKAAQILDSPERVTLHPTTLRQLNDIIGKLTEKKKTKSGGRLASVKAMSGGARKTS